MSAVSVSVVDKGRFPDEEVVSKYVYPPEYQGLKSPAGQVKALLEYFPGLDPEPMLRYFADEYRRLSLPDWVEGPMVIPSDSGMRRLFFPDLGDLAQLNCACVNLALERIAPTRSFHNYRAGEIVPSRFLRHERTTDGLARVAKAQPGDFWVIPCQMGMRHRGCSTRRATHDKFVSGEFGATAFAGLCHALVHPERYMRYDELDADFPGDKSAPGADGGFSCAPYLRRYDDGLFFGTKYVVDAFEDFGAASWFFPQ